MLVLALILVGVSAVGLFASDEKLIGMHRIIGTKNPKFARVICAVALLAGIGMGIAAIRG